VVCAHWSDTPDASAPFSVRPQPGASVSTPLKWQEVNNRLDPSKFTMRTVGKRIDMLGDLWKPVLESGFILWPA
jgi:bifunctional non-homologous end joining protein LigD